MGGSKLQEVTTILFDLDNTLVDTKGADRLACEEVYQMLMNDGVKRQAAKRAVSKFYELVREKPQDPTEVNADVDNWRTILWKEALGPKLMNYAPAAYELWRNSRMKHMKFGPEMQNLLLDLRKEYKLGLVTNGPSTAQWEKIQRINGQLFFDAIVVSGDVQREKPHRSIFEEAFRRLDVSSMECVMVGDKLDTDIKGGIKSNCAATVWVTSSGEPLDSVHPRPDYKIEDVRELPSILPQRNRFPSLQKSQALGFYHKLHESPPTWRKKLQW